MNPQLFPVPFHQDTIVLVGQNDEPFVAMKPIIENIGLSWNSQHTKLRESFASTIAIIGMVAEDGKQREMVCLPLRKLPAWLYSISPNKVAAGLREKVIQYQEECDDALWRYWTQGTATRTGKHSETRSKQINTALRLIAAKNRTAEPRDRQLIDNMLAEIAAGLGFSYQADMLDGAA